MCGSLNCPNQDPWTGDCTLPRGKETCGEEAKEDAEIYNR